VGASTKELEPNALGPEITDGEHMELTAAGDEQVAALHPPRSDAEQRSAV
jgi:hypothetical protein